jgi:hypothetical protein
VSRSDVLELARAVARPNTLVRFLDEDNESAGTTHSLREAVMTGRAFAVEVRGDILALDADCTAAQAAVPWIVRELASHGIEAVVVASGQADHRHIFARVTSPPLLARLGRTAVDRKMDWRHGGALIRPPLSPHRLPDRHPVLLAPATVAWAVGELLPLHQTPLSDVMMRLLKHGDVGGAYRDSKRSGVLQGLVNSMFQHGWSFEQAQAALMDESNVGGEKLQERATKTPAGARRMLVNSWAKARAYVRAHPPGGSKEIVAELARTRDAITSRRWPGQAGTTDRAIMLALVDIGIAISQVVVSASIRQLAGLVGRQQYATVMNSLDRLQDGKWIRRETKGSGKTSSRYRLLKPPPNTNTPLTTSKDIGGCETNGAIEYAHHDLWRYGGLPKNAGVIYAAMHATHFETPTQISQRVVLPVATVRRNLKKLELQGMVTRDEHGGWKRIDVDLDVIADRLGTAGKGAAQRAVFREERIRYRGGQDPDNPLRFIAQPSFDSDVSAEIIEHAVLEMEEDLKRRSI